MYIVPDAVKSRGITLVMYIVPDAVKSRGITLVMYVYCALFSKGELLL